MRFNCDIDARRALDEALYCHVDSAYDAIWSIDEVRGADDIAALGGHDKVQREPALRRVQEIIEPLQL